jgi:predicted metal-dependent phosphoesterase TrpH
VPRGRILDVDTAVLKIELHSHTSDDPCDVIPYDTFELIDAAAAQGYQALAVTLHDRQLDLAPFVGFAAERGVTLIPGIERTICGKHVLLLNFSAAATEAVRSFDDVRRLKQLERGLVIAPHPFFPAPPSLMSLAFEHQDIFDAVEYNAMFTASLNFNRKAERWARERELPIVGNGDVHRLMQLGTTWSSVDADPHPDAICEAIREGRVTFHAQPLDAVKAARIIGSLLVADLKQGLAWKGPGRKLQPSIHA